MGIRLILIIFSIFVILSLRSSGQQFGGTPLSVRWQQIHTDTARIIFPDGLYKQASEIAALIHRIPNYSESSIGKAIAPINIVLRNQTLISNGYVGMGLYRSEFQLTPLQNSFRLGSIPWHLTLGLHEYRHVQQYNNFRQGLSKVFYNVLGEEAGALMNNIAVPNWFWEGDAVFQETYLSEQGRGRIPFFFNDFKALWAADKDYSWMKIRNGSLRDLVPSHYALGYIMVLYGRQQFGTDIWRSVTADAVRFKGLIYPFQKAFKRHSGTDYKVFRNHAIAGFKDSAVANYTEDPVIESGKRFRHIVYDAAFPQWISENEIVYVRSSPEHIPAFIRKNIHTGNELLIRKRDISIDNQFSYRNNRIIYASYERDLRWGWKDFGSIRIIDVETGREKRLTNKTRYFSPDINQNGDKIITVAMNEDGSSNLHLLDGYTGKVIRILKNENNQVHTYPKFYDEDHIISAVRNQTGEMAIARININNDSVTYPVPFDSHIIGYINTKNDTIIYSRSAENHDVISITLNEKQFDLESVRATKITGNYQPALYQGNLSWTIPTAAGNQLVIARNDEVRFISRETIQTKYKPVTLPLEIPSINILDNLPDSAYAFKPYPKGFQLFNFHSLRPYVSDPEYSMTLVSENILNTIRSEVFFTFNRNENSKQVGLITTYAGLFPWLRTGIDYTIDRNAINNNNRVYWNEIQPRAGVSLPLNFTAGRYYRSLLMGSDFVYNKRSYQGVYKDSFEARGFSYISSYVQYNSQIQKAVKHIYPRFAQNITITWRKAITRLDNSQFLVSSSLYFPGLHSTHNLVLQGAFHQRDSSRLLFGNTFPFSRGYTVSNFRRMVRSGINYHFPLLYPDKGIGNIVYVLRVRSNVFYDHSRVFSEQLDQARDFRSVGTDLYFDTKWWNQHNVSFGIRYSRLLDRDILNRSPNQWELILPVNLFNN